MAETIKGMEAVNLGDGNAATYYTDGSVVIWDITTGNQTGGWGPQQNQVSVEGSPGGAWGVAAPTPDLGVQHPVPIGRNAPNPRAPTGPVGTGRPGEDFNYGPTRPGTGRYPGAMPGQTFRPGQTMPGIPFGSTVAPSTWNPAGQGRGEGWGSITAGTVGQPYGWGVPGFGQAPIKINEYDLPHLFNSSPGMAPGYIPGSGTYNQYRLDSPSNQFGAQYGGLFGPVGPNNTIVNTRYGLGGTGDPTNGSEVQSPRWWLTGNPNDSHVAELGDDAWRRAQGVGR